MAVKGAILGDILGSPYEGEKPENPNVGLYGVKPLRFTDDTVTTLAIKKAILDGDDLTDTMVDVCRDHIFAGYGQTFIEWLLDDKHYPYNSWGNGAAMRVSFIGEYFDDINTVQKMAKESACISHNHPEGVKGAVVTATCIWMAKNKYSKQDIYDYVLSEYPENMYKYPISLDLNYLRKKYEWDISCMGSVPVAMRCFYESTDYESFIRNVFSLDCDIDTLGAIGGGVAEEFYNGFGHINADYILETHLTHDLYRILVM